VAACGELGPNKIIIMEKEDPSNFRIELPKFDVEKFIVSDLQKIKNLDVKSEYYAEAFYRRLADYIIKFEADLDQSMEVGAKLVSFGESIIIHVDSIGYWNPQLITFNGVDTNGNKVQLIQNTNQISFLLIALPRSIPERPRIGYKLQQVLEKESKSQDDNQ
jgi:hypothetical protein